MDASHFTGVTSIFGERYETGLGIRVAIIDGSRNLRDDPDRLRSWAPAPLRPRTQCDGPSHRHHAGDCGHRVAGRQNIILAVGTFSPPALGYGQSLGCRCWSASVALRRGGQSDGEGGAFARALALRANTAAVHLDDCFADGETEPETFRPHFELLERSENFLEKLRFNANAVVGHFNSDRIWRVVVGAN